MIKLTAGTSSIILPLHDTNGELQEWIDKHYATELMRIMAPPSGLYTRRGSNLPFPNYSSLPSPKINQLVLPTGASRWGYTLLLATEEQKEEIYTAQSETGLMTLHWSAPLVGDLGPTGQAVNETDSETNRTVKLLVHCLPPRPVTPRGRLQDDGFTSLPGVSRRIEGLENNGYPQASDLFLIPVVDARYFLQFLDVGEMSAEDFTSDAGPHTDTFNAGDKTSAELIYIYLESLIPASWYGGFDGFVKCDDISPKYITPPDWTSTNDYENLGVVLDAFCWQHGLAFVPVVSQTYTTNDGGLVNTSYPFAVVSVDESVVLYRGSPDETNNQYGAIRGCGGIGKSVRTTGTSLSGFSRHDGGKKFCGMPLLIAGGDTYRRAKTDGTRTALMEGRPLPDSVDIESPDGIANEPPPTVFNKWPARTSGTDVSKLMADAKAKIRYAWSGSLSADEKEQIAKDYYNRFLWQFDYTFLGVQPWQQSAYDDVTVYSMNQVNGQYVCQTRVMSWALNTQADICGGDDSSSSNIRVGIVRGQSGSMFYEIELGSMPRDAYGNGSDCIDCDPCTSVFGAGTSGCGITISDPESIVVPDGQTITAYDPFSDKIPLKVGTDCVVAKVSGTGNSYGYGGTPTGDTWVVLNGYHEHIVEYKERWDCCDPDGPPTLLAKTPIILIGVACAEIICGECPPPA